MGRHTKHGGYIVDYDKVRTYVVPEGLKDFNVSCDAIPVAYMALLTQR